MVNYLYKGAFPAGHSGERLSAIIGHMVWNNSAEGSALIFFSLCLTTCRLNNEGQPTSICIEDFLRMGTVVGKHTNMSIILWGNDPLNGGDKCVTVFKSKKRRDFDFRASSVFSSLHSYLGNEVGFQN